MRFPFRSEKESEWTIQRGAKYGIKRSWRT